MLGQQEAGTGTAGLPAFEGETVAHATGVILEQLLGGNAEGQFPDAGVLHLAGEAHQLGAMVAAVRAGQRGVPLHAVADDGRYVAQGFDVVHAGRLAPHTHRSREGRFGPGVGPAAFQRVDQRGFFTADITPGTGVHEQLEIETRTENVLAQQACRLGFFHRLLQVAGGIDILATQEDITAIGLECPRRDQHALDQQVRQLLHQQPVFPGVGLHLVGVAQQIADVLRFVRRHQAPLHPGGEAGTTAALEAGVLDRADNVGSSHLGQRLAGGGIAVFLLVLFQPHRLPVVAQTPGHRMGFFAAGNPVGRAEG